MPSDRSLKFTRLVNASPAEAARMFTHATALRDWLCNAAHTAPREGGHIFLRWDDGYAASGTFTKFDPGKRLTFTWNGSGEPAATQVAVTFTPKGEATRVAVTHSGFGSGRQWRTAMEALAAAWPLSLENLQSVLETGIDLRFARRPRLGIFIGDLNAQIAQQLGVPISRGIRLEGTAEGSGARAAGLQKDDVIVAFNGKKVNDPEGLGPLLVGLKAGDKPPVTFYRGAQKHTLPLELSRFPIPEMPEHGAELAEKVRALHAKVDAAFAQAVDGLSEAEAERRPAENEWSAKEMLAHFILTERDYQSWVANMLNDTPVNDDLEFRPNVNERVRALVSRLGTVAALRQELTLAEAETACLLESLPETFIRNRKHLYRRVASWGLEVTVSHWENEHAEQMQRTVTAARL